MLLSLVQAAQVNKVSVVGLAKNAGKTVALNSLISQAAEQELPLGLTSLGYDGEKVDLLTRLPKPRIHVPLGTIVATAEGTLERSEARLELLQATDFLTALGTVVLVRVREPGYIEIAGPDTLTEIKSVSKAMRQLGCHLVLIDGALDRLGSAAPGVAEATILATGASVSSDQRRVMQKTLHAVSLLTAPVVQGELREAVDACLAANLVGWYHPDSGLCLSAYSSLLGHQSALIEEAANATHLIVPGALTDSFLGPLLQAHPRGLAMTIVVPDGTHVFCSPEVTQRFYQRGGQLQVVKQAQLLAVTVNPTSPTGSSFVASEFAAAMAEALYPVPVYDLFVDERSPVSVLAR